MVFTSQGRSEKEETVSSLLSTALDLRRQAVIKTSRTISSNADLPANEQQIYIYLYLFIYKYKRA